jgi:hypothetical protein
MYEANVRHSVWPRFLGREINRRAAHAGWPATSVSMAAAGKLAESGIEIERRG